jgi:hypothetical protein
MSVIIKDIKKNNNEIIRIEVSEFKGRDLINIRVWYQAIGGDKGDVVYKPTQKGITINISEFAELKDGILKLENYLNDVKKGTVPEQPLDKKPSVEVVEEKED